MSTLYKLVNGFDSFSGAAFGGGGGGGPVLPPSILHKQYTNPHAPLPKAGSSSQPTATSQVTAVSLLTQNNAYTQSTSWSNDFKQCLGDYGAAANMSGYNVSATDTALACSATTTYKRW
jgi:hypothetical protein